MHVVTMKKKKKNLEFVRLWAMYFTETHPLVTKFQIEKLSNAFSETLGKDKHFFSLQ